MGDSCRYLTLRILLCKQKERTAIGTLFSKTLLLYIFYRLADFHR